MNLPPDIVKSLLKSKEGKVLVIAIRQEVAKLDSISEMKTNFSDPRAIAIETVGRKRAIEILKDMLEPLVDFQDKNTDAEGKEVY